MLLGRTASGLYWMYRYIERAENIARIVDAGLRMALTRTSDAPAEWSSVLVSSGTDDGYRQKYDAYAADTVTDYLLRDRDNPSSVLSCIEAARSNARMVRTALTREAWESVNGAWLALRRRAAGAGERTAGRARPGEARNRADPRQLYSTMLRNEIFDFAQIGAFVERADNTARIIDVKYHLLLPSVSHVGTILDNYQWETILRCVAAHRSYRWVYDVQYKPMNIADYLILNGRMPRSLRYCYGRVVSSLNLLAKDYGVTPVSRHGHEDPANAVRHLGRADLQERPARVPDRLHRPQQQPRPKSPRLTTSTETCHATRHPTHLALSVRRSSHPCTATAAAAPAVGRQTVRAWQVTIDGVEPSLSYADGRQPDRPRAARPRREGRDRRRRGRRRRDAGPRGHPRSS